MSTETDVIIIGAGAAGLSAATELDRQGLSYIVVEGSHRIGGRAYSEEIAPDVWFDLGCAYLVTGPDAENRMDETNPYVDFARERGLAIEEYLHPARYIRDGKPLTVQEQMECDGYYQACGEAIQQSVARNEDRAITDLIDLDSLYATPYVDMMAVTVPHDLDVASATDFYHKVKEHRNYNTLCGYGNLVAQWGSDIEVSLNNRVERVDWSGTDIRVKTAKGSISARYLISTVSNGVLAAQHIDFSPGLPGWKMEAVEGVHMGTENKIGVHFTDDVFAPESSGYYQTWSSSDHGAYVDVNIMSSRVVTVFIGGRFSVWMESQGAQTAHEFAVERIAEIFGSSIKQAVGRSIASAWYTDPWTLGSYAIALPGEYHQRAALPQAIDDRLFFAGEATARVNGTCNGAYWSGYRAAQEVAVVHKAGIVT